MREVGFGVVIFFVLAIVIGAIMFVIPQYNVWQQTLAGEAQLKRAEQERRIMVTQAEAELESAQKKADAIKIVGEAAAAFPEYRTQEFIQAFAEALRDGSISQIIYVPTEANIPITEAGSMVSPLKRPGTR